MKAILSKPIRAQLIGLLAIAGLALMTGCTVVDAEDDDDDRTTTTTETIEQRVVTPPVSATVETTTMRSY